MIGNEIKNEFVLKNGNRDGDGDQPAEDSRKPAEKNQPAITRAETDKTASRQDGRTPTETAAQLYCVKTPRIEL